MEPDEDGTFGDALLRLGILAGRATNEREFKNHVEAFRALLASFCDRPNCRSLASALNANHD